jgi:hypothetical protein
MRRPVRGALRAAVCGALLAVGCGGRTSGTGTGETGSVGGSAGVITGSSGSYVVVSGVPTSGSSMCMGGCICFSTPETCPAGCYPQHDSTGAFVCGNGPAIGSACVTDSDCSAPGALTCAFDIAAGCSAKGTCQAVEMGGLCADSPACTCAGTTDPAPTCGFGNNMAHEPIAYEGPCTDGGPIASDAGPIDDSGPVDCIEAGGQCLWNSSQTFCDGVIATALNCGESAAPDGTFCCLGPTVTGGVEAGAPTVVADASDAGEGEGARCANGIGVCLADSTGLCEQVLFSAVGCGAGLFCCLVAP